MVFKYVDVDVLANLISLGMKIINSVVGVGLYYGFLNTLSIGPSYIFLLRAWVMEEETEERVSATTGFILGQFIMFTSVYYAPLHLALNRPHTITVLVLPYLLFHSFRNNHKDVVDYRYNRFTIRNSYGSTTRKSMRSLSIQCVFLNNLIFQLFNNFIFPSSTLSRLVNIYMFRCNNKILFVISSFVGWFIGHILFLKCVGLVLFWIRKTLRSNKKYRYLLVEWRYSTNRIFKILLFITFVYYLARVSLPIFGPKLGEKTRINEELKLELEFEDDQDELLVENSYLDENQENFQLEINNNKIKKLSGFQRPLVTLLFDYKLWNRPLRYIKNNRFDNAVKKEMSQYFFYTCQSDGKQRISFTYPPSLSTFFEMIQQRMPLCTTEKLSPEELYNNWVYTNKQKRDNLSNELINRIEALDRGSPAMDVLEKRTRLCNDKTKQKYLPKTYDPLLKGSHRGIIKKLDLRSSMNDDSRTSIKDSKETLWINKLHDIFSTDYEEFEGTIDTLSDLDRKSAANFKGLYLFSENGRLDSKKKSKYLYDAIRTYSITKASIRIRIRIKKNEIQKKVPRWSYKLIGNLTRASKEPSADRALVNKRAIFRIPLNVQEYREFFKRGQPIWSRRFVDAVNFRRKLIKGSARAQRRKTFTSGSVFQPQAESPLFFNKIYNFFYWFNVSKISRAFTVFFSDWLGKEVKITKEEKLKNKEEDEELREILRRRVKLAWEKESRGFIKRGSILLIQSILRKYIIGPSLIIVKNVVRGLLYESTEWSKDWEDWKRERHIYCNYDGAELPGLPLDWFIRGIQIKIVCPFHLKSRHRSRSKKKQKYSSCFLTVFGMEAERPFGLARKRIPLLKPIFKQFRKKRRKVPKEKPIWVLKIVQIVQFIKNRMQELEKVSPISLFGLREVDESNLNRNKQKLIISNQKSNQTIPESSILIRFRSRDWKNDSPTEKRIKDLAEKTSRTRNEIDKIKKARKTLLITRGIGPNQTSWYKKRFESPKRVWQILKRRGARLIPKFRYFFMKIFIEKRIYIDIFLRIVILRIINIIESTSINVQILLKLTQQIADKYSYKTNKNKIFRNSHCDHSSLSQAYVFYKLSQTQAINSHHWKSIFQYDGTTPFIKYRIKDLFVKKEIFHSESRHKKLHSFGMNEWKSWLMGNDHYQYNLPQPIWSGLLAQKWRNRINQSLMVQKKNSTNFDSSEKDQLIHYEKQNNYAVNSLPSQKEKFLKNYKYDLLANQYLNYDYKKGSAIYKLRFQENKPGGVSYNYKTYNPELFYYTGELDLSNYISDMDQNTDRKYFDWRIINFCLRKKSDIEKWTNMDSGASATIKKNTKTRTNYYQIIDKTKKTDKKDLLNMNLAIHKQINPLVNWMGMNEEEEIEILNCPRSNPELWFFPEFILLYKIYHIQPWIIPINSLFLQKNINENISENNKIQINERQKYVQKNLGAFLRQQIIKETKVTGRLSELKLFLLKFDYYQRKRAKNVREKLKKNSSGFFSLLKLKFRGKNPTRATLSLIQRNEISPDVMMKPKAISISKLLKRGLLIIEPTRLSIKWDGQFIMYQTLAISQVHKRSRNKSTAQHKIFFWNRDKNHYDFVVPENILSRRRRRELRILICLNSRNANVGDRNPVGTNAKNCDPFFHRDKHLDVDTNQFIKFKLFLWPNYRLEDLACMNRYWFDTANGSRFSMTRIRMYPRLRIS
uniref:Protein TIC 214 n=1 Tax=Nigella arvensis subsp. brevifolia TaxID=342651 RepID=A0AAU6Q931_9MAGN